jgi:endonuclease YncB( thermonuclease family)
MPFSEERTKLIKGRLSESLSSGKLDKWALSFLRNMQRVFDRDGSKTTLSDAQFKKLHELLKLETTDAQTSTKRSPQRPTVQPRAPRQSRARTRPMSPLRAINAPKRAIRRLERQIALPVLIIAGLFALIASLFEPSSSSSSFTDVKRADQHVGYVTGNSVNQREGPSTSHRVMGSLRKGTRVDVLKQQAAWSKINSPLGEGWMSSKYISFQIAQSTAPSSDHNSLNAHEIRVIDGDTIAISGLRANVRLVGFNTPETNRAKCSAERTLGNRATARLRGLISSAQRIRFQQKACSCKLGTQGTKQCNYGRLCGTLTVDGLDVGNTLISESLAVRYRCGRTSCPPRPGNWCG